MERYFHHHSDEKINVTMNTPNKLTILRVLLVPIFLIFLMIEQIPYHYIYALVFFIAASLTDLLDGYLARKNNQVTTFGKFLDPLADKVLVLAAMICFIELGLASAIAVIIIVAREFMVTSIRLVASTTGGKVIAASMIGKVKTVIQMVAIIATLLMLSFNQFVSITQYINISLFSNVLMWIAATITVISGAEYLIQNKSAINTTK